MNRKDATALVREQRDALHRATAGYSRENWNAWSQRRDEANAAAIAALTEAGAVIRDDWRGIVVKFDGIRVTCTGGISGALGNWLARAAKEAVR